MSTTTRIQSTTGEARQGADGYPHATYFDQRTQASFVWDGESDEIEVSIGGYGEPVDHYIDAHVVVQKGQIIPVLKKYRTPRTDDRVSLRFFGEVCRIYAATLPDY